MARMSYFEYKEKSGRLVTPTKINDLRELVDTLSNYQFENTPPLLKSKLASLIDYFSNSFSEKTNPSMSYYISNSEYEDVESILEFLLTDQANIHIKGLLRHTLSNILAIWKNLDDAKKGQEPLNPRHLKGLIDQLTTRQNEINTQAKNVVEEIKERSDSASANITRHAQRQSNQLSIQAKDLQSELLSQIETTANNAKINIKDESSKLWRELTEEITLTVDSTLEKKQKEIHDRNERHVKLLLEKVESEVSDLSKKVNEQINDFCVLNDALRKTLNFVASDALADTSIKQAKEEQATADSLRGWGVLWLIASIALFLVTFDYDKLVDENNVPQYTLILLRSFFLVVGITPGFYLLRESARHRTDERRYRQKGIQLATIDGYFAEFEDSERNKVKKDLSKHYFHGAEHFVDSSSVDHVQSKYDKIFDKVASSKKFN
ncbi:TPA: hypothetical protein O4H68_000351 [Vibrio alginolyticus]|nr:hypothetical protein [Vibrio alginolyticus]